MKDVYEVLRQKELEVQRIRNEIAALHSVIPLLVDEGDWIQHGGVLPFSHSAKNDQEKGIEHKPA
jgi:hypothetical protein